MCTRTSTLSALSTLPEANFGARRYGNANGIASTAVIRTVPANVSTASPSRIGTQLHLLEVSSSPVTTERTRPTT